MKTKKLSLIISSMISELILQNRNASYEQSMANIEGHQKQIGKMHLKNNYSKELYYDLVEKPQYNIQKKLNAKQNRILSDSSVLIHFKLTEKLNSSFTFIQSWLVSTQKTKKVLKNSKVDFNEELVYLLQQVIRALKCQFLIDFLNMAQSFRTKYILDYQVQVNPSKRNLKRLSSLQYEYIWRKQAFIDEQNQLSVTCFHNTHKRIKSIISQNKVQSRYQTAKPNLKHGSQETKPSNSGEYEVSTSVEDKTANSRQRKTSLFEFYDQDLNMTVLSNDSDSFKKSTGRIEGVYVNQNFLDQKSDKEYDSEDQFQLLIEEDITEQQNKIISAQKKYAKIKQVQKQYQRFLQGLDKVMHEFFN